MAVVGTGTMQEVNVKVAIRVSSTYRTVTDGISHSYRFNDNLIMEGHSYQSHRAVTNTSPLTDNKRIIQGDSGENRSSVAGILSVSSQFRCIAQWQNSDSTMLLLNVCIAYKTLIIFQSIFFLECLPDYHLFLFFEIFYAYSLALIITNVNIALSIKSIGR